MDFKEWWRTHSRTLYEQMGLSRREITAIVVITAGVLFGGIVSYIMTSERVLLQPNKHDSLRQVAQALATVADSMASTQENHRRLLQTLALAEARLDSAQYEVDTLRESLGIDTTDAEETVTSMKVTEALKLKKPGEMKPIDIRTASEGQLRLLPTIGKITAQKIILYRRVTMFDHVEDLMRVKGIGTKRFQKLRPYLLDF